MYHPNYEGKIVLLLPLYQPALPGKLAHSHPVEDPDKAGCP